MKTHLMFSIFAVALAACVHTPPGTSVNVALAKKAELIRLPGPPPGSVAANGRSAVIEPELPGNSTTDRVAEAFSRGQFCMQAGKDAEAIAAFEQAVKIDPSFIEAWQHLAILYEKTGQEKKALEAFRRARKVAQG